MNVRSKSKVTTNSVESLKPIKKSTPEVLNEDLQKLIGNLNALKKQSPAELIQIGKLLGLEDLAHLHKKGMIFALLKESARRGIEIIGSGVLHVMEEYGFLRSSESSYVVGPDDIYLSRKQIKYFNLRTGDTVLGKIRPPKESERYFALLEVKAINGDSPENSKNKVLFENLVPLYAEERLVLERTENMEEDITGRVLDLIVPLGKGQRGLIVAPPKTGKTMMLQSIAQSISHNHPECYLIVLLVGERPEEVTDMQRSVKGEVIASTFDEPPSRQIQLAEIVIEKAKRLVEHKQDVVILMDSITRLARAYNASTPSSGKVLTGGVDSNALQPLKRFFGAARNIEEGGSLTIIATALIDTGSKMDEVVHEEIKGTGNVGIRLLPESAEKAIYPAIDFSRSGIRREERLLPKELLQKLWILRRILISMEKVASIEFLNERLRKTKSNAEFLEAMKNVE